MHTEHEIVVRSESSRVYSLAAAVEDWPRLLPHYRWVRILREEGNRRLVAMGARHRGIPLSWRCEQELQPEVPRLRFRHVDGITKGMTAEWTFEPGPEGVRVKVLHDLEMRWPVIGPYLCDRVIGPYFVGPISEKTLVTIGKLSEA